MIVNDYNKENKKVDNMALLKTALLVASLGLLSLPAYAGDPLPGESPQQESRSAADFEAAQRLVDEGNSRLASGPVEAPEVTETSNAVTETSNAVTETSNAELSGEVDREDTALFQRARAWVESTTQAELATLADKLNAEIDVLSKSLHWSAMLENMNTAHAQMRLTFAETERAYAARLAAYAAHGFDHPITHAAILAYTRAGEAWENATAAWERAEVKVIGARDLYRAAQDALAAAVEAHTYAVGQAERARAYLAWLLAGGEGPSPLEDELNELRDRINDIYTKRP